MSLFLGGNCYVITTNHSDHHLLCTMGAIITGKVHNTVASLTGAACLVLTHILSIEDCIDAVDVETICILVGMMLLVAVIKNSGIFEYIAIKAAKIAKVVHGQSW